GRRQPRRNLLGELGREGCGEVVAARFDEDEIEVGEPLAHLGDRREVDRGVLADRGMRAAAGLDADDPLRSERAGFNQNPGVLFGVDVVGDGRDVELVAQALAKLLHHRGLARPDRSTDPDAQRLAWRCHDRNSLEYWLSCRMAAMSERNAAPPRSARLAPRAARAKARMGAKSAARIFWPSVCPIAPRRKAAETRLAAWARAKASRLAPSGRPWPLAAAATAIGWAMRPLGGGSRRRKGSQSQAA